MRSGSLWIDNSIAARIDRATLLDLAARDDVAFIQPDQYRRWIEPDLTASPTSNVQSARTSALSSRAAAWRQLLSNGTSRAFAPIKCGRVQHHGHRRCRGKPGFRRRSAAPGLTSELSRQRP